MKKLPKFLIGLISVSLVLLHGWLSPAIANQPQVSPDLLNFTRIPFNQFPAVTCTAEMKAQFQNAQVPFDCNIGESLPAERVLAIGNFTNMGITKLSLALSANANNIDLKNVRADQLYKFYSLITPKKLLTGGSGVDYQNKPLAEMPMMREGFIQKLAVKAFMEDPSRLQNLNEQLGNMVGDGFIDLSVADLENTDLLRQKVEKIALGKLVKAFPEFGEFSLGELSDETFTNFSVAEAMPDLVNQAFADVEGVESLMVGDLTAVGVSNYAMNQLPNPIAPVAGVMVGRFDLPLSKDEHDPRRKLSGGITDSDSKLRQQACGNNCKFAEIAVPNTNYHGAAWMDGAEHWVDDGFGIVCSVWPGGCKGPAGNNPVGADLRLLLTNIDAKAGTAQVSFTMPICRDTLLFGRTCTPSVFPFPSGFPLYTIHEGDGILFVPPVNYRASLLPLDALIQVG
jgi:hypothetical protein